MIHSLVELVVYVFLELSAYAFVRVFAGLALSVVVALVICCFISDRALHISVIALGLIVGFIFGVVWEVLAWKNPKKDNDRR